MLPSAPFALLVFLALIPGWIYFRLAERRGPRPERSQLVELLELAAVGFTAITTAAIIVAALSLTLNHWLFDIRAWALQRHQYLGDHLAAALTSIVVGVILSCLIVLGMFWVAYRKKTASFNPGANVWDLAVGPSPAGQQNWLGVHRPDGSLVEGLLLGYPAGSSEEIREIALSRPIRLTPKDGSASYLPIDRVVIPGDQIIAITVLHVPEPETGPATVRPPRGRGSPVSGHLVLDRLSRSRATRSEGAP
jgi:hypothetical protein